MRRPICRWTILIALLLLATAGSPAAAAEPGPHPWSSYFPAAGTTCTSAVYHEIDADREQRITILSKNRRSIVFRGSGGRRSTIQLLPGGRQRVEARLTDRDGGWVTRLGVAAELPSPVRLARHGRGHARAEMRMTLPPRVAQLLLLHGRTLTIDATYRVAGLGSRAVALDDDSKVDAVGVRIRLRSLRFGNARPVTVRELRSDMRTAFASFGGTSWYSRGRGVVRSSTTDTDGWREDSFQIGCRQTNGAHVRAQGDRRVPSSPVHLAREATRDLWSSVKGRS